MKYGNLNIKYFLCIKVTTHARVKECNVVDTKKEVVFVSIIYTKSS